MIFLLKESFSIIGLGIIFKFYNSSSAFIEVIISSLTI